MSYSLPLTLNRKLSLESRYGTYLVLPWAMLPRAMITLPNAERDLLMLPASYKKSTNIHIMSRKDWCKSPTTAILGQKL